MEASLHEIAHFVALAIEAIAIAVIAIGAIEAVIGIARVQLVWSKTKTDLSRGGVMVETEHPTEPDSSIHRATRWN